MRPAASHVWFAGHAVHRSPTRTSGAAQASCAGAWLRASGSGVLSGSGAQASTAAHAASSADSASKKCVALTQSRRPSACQRTCAASVSAASATSGRGAESSVASSAYSVSVHARGRPTSNVSSTCTGTVALVMLPCVPLLSTSKTGSSRVTLRSANTGARRQRRSASAARTGDGSTSVPLAYGSCAVRTAGACARTSVRFASLALTSARNSEVCCRRASVRRNATESSPGPEASGDTCRSEKLPVLASAASVRPRSASVCQRPAASTCRRTWLALTGASARCSSAAALIALAGSKRQCTRRAPKSADGGSGGARRCCTPLPAPVYRQCTCPSPATRV